MTASRQRVLTELHSMGAGSLAPASLRATFECLDTWCSDPEVVATAANVLTHWAEARRDGEGRHAAERVSNTVLRCLQSLSADARTDPDRAGYLWMNRANALRLLGPAHAEDALRAYESALSLDGSRGAWWLDLALFHKEGARFTEALSAALRARARMGETRPVLFNMAICATATGEGDLAAGAWRRLGLQVELAQSGMPHVPNLPPLLVRVRGSDPDDFQEVCAEPLSPCHGVISTPTRGPSAVDYGDLVLWDCRPVTVRPGNDVPCMPLLARLRKGTERRWPFLMTDDSQAFEEMSSMLPSGARMFLWASPGDALCASCMDTAESAGPAPALREGKLVARAEIGLDALTHALRGGIERGSMVVPALPEALGDTAWTREQQARWAAMAGGDGRAGP